MGKIRSVENQERPDRGDKINPYLSPHGEEKRDIAARSDQELRLLFNPIPPGGESTRNRNAPTRLAALKKLHMSVAADLSVNGEPMKCASELQWGHERREE